MKISFVKPSLFINVLMSIAFILFLNTWDLKSQSFKVAAVSDLTQVFEDGYNPPPASDTLKVFGIRGEILSGQIAVNAKSNITNLSVEISSLKNQTTGNSLPANNTEWNFVGSIPLSKNTPNQPPSVVVRRAPAKFPDYLMIEKQLNINKGAYQAIWLTITVPENAEAGIYSGKVTVKSNQGEQFMPVNLTIYPLTLPEERHLKVTEWYSTRNFSRIHGIQEEYSDAWFAMLRKYAENMVTHRQNIFQVPMNSIGIQKTNTGELQFDFTRFDQIAQVFWNTRKMDYLETGELAKFEKDWFGPNIILKDFPVINKETGEKMTMPGSDVVPVLLPAFENHLRQKGWLNRTLFHIKDEPTLVNARSWREMSRYMHKLAPDLTRIDAVETTYLFGDIEISVPKLDYLGANYDVYKKGQQNGAELWFYTVGIYQGNTFLNKTIDMPVIESRLMHWLNYKYDLSGYLHWGWNQWTENPFQEVGQHIGDGWHVYPAKDGVLNSIRWEQMRNGIQDYEYFWMLENKIQSLKDSLGKRFEWIDPKQRGKEIAGRVVIELDEHTHTPDVLYNAKKAVIKELIELNISPRIFVQTLPFENSAVKTNEYLTEVYGWTEPGTKIIINKQVIPGTSQGLFMKNFSLGTNRTIIRIEASGEKGSKVIERTFVVE